MLLHHLCKDFRKMQLIGRKRSLEFIWSNKYKSTDFLLSWNIFLITEQIYWPFIICFRKFSFTGCLFSCNIHLSQNYYCSSIDPDFFLIFDYLLVHVTIKANNEIDNRTMQQRKKTKYDEITSKCWFIWTLKIWCEC